MTNRTVLRCLLAGALILSACDDGDGGTDSGPLTDAGPAPVDSGPGDAGPPAETCSDGTMNQDETDVDCGGTCGATCTPGDMCGANGDCTTDICEGGTCQPMPTCSDGAMNGTETDVDCGGSMCMACDDGDMCAMDSDCTSSFCSSMVCTATVCGDGMVQGAEDCDDGSGGMPAETATCDLDCSSAMCGDGTLNATAGEACDGDGAGMGGETATCDTDCTPALCGDGLVNATAGEACDGDGAGMGGETATCNRDCTTSMCGDGVVNPTAGEACDDGNTVDTDSCTNACAINGAMINITGASTFDTGTGELDGVVAMGWNTTTNTWDVGSFTVAVGGTLVVSGPNNFVVNAAVIDVAGTIDASGQDGTPGDGCNSPVNGIGGLGGPGGSPGGDGAPGSVTVPTVSFDGLAGGGPGGGLPGTTDSSGGGGGGHLTVGSDGAGTNFGAGGPAYDGVTAMTGGSGGGGGSADDDGGDDDAGAGGGGGGGYVDLNGASGVTVSGLVDASGGNGGNTDCSGNSGSGGGGSGGVIFIGGPPQNITGTLDVSGGLGGTFDFAGGRGSDGIVFLRGSCTDGLINQDESDVDCGGATCAGCSVGFACRADADCSSANACLFGICRPMTCTDGTMNGMETDVDCGGSECLPCGGGQMCATGADCRSATCTAGLCEATGELIWMGHDWFSTNPDMDRLLANAILTSEAPGTIDVVIYDEFADNSATGEVANVVTAINTVLPTLGRAASITRLSDNTMLAAALATADVLIIAEQEVGDATTLQGIATAWNPLLLSFLNGGGTVIVHTFFDPSFELINNTNLMTFTGELNATGSPVSFVVPTSPLFVGVTDGYSAADGSITFAITGGTTVATSGTPGAPIIQVREYP